MPGGVSQVPIRVGSALVVRDDRGRVLLGRRAKDPNRGRWVLPGGKVEQFETIEAAARRELREEAGIDVEVREQIGAFEIIAPPAEHRVIIYSWAEAVDSDIRPAGDLSEVCFVEPSDLSGMDLTEICTRVLSFAGLTGRPVSQVPDGAREALAAQFNTWWICTCHEAYKDRDLTDPSCARCLLWDDVLDAIPAALSAAGYTVVKADADRINQERSDT